MINYTEGRVTIDGQTVTANSDGKTELEPGQVLSTIQGKAEMLLTPGVFLRLGDNASVRMVSPSLTDTRVELLKGEAMVEADQVLRGNHLVIADHGVDTSIEKNGLYRFTTDPGQVAVYDGKAQVFLDEHAIDVGKGKQVALTQVAEAKIKPDKFDRHQSDSLYQWSDVRSQYVAEANQSSVQYIVDANPWGWGMGWYWNPWFSSWAFVPGDGFFASPFGYGFYSPVYWRTYAPQHYYSRPGVIATNPRARGFVGGGMHAAPAMRGAGGFSRGGFGGGGFHGGGRR